MAEKNTTSNTVEITIEEKLIALYKLQTIDSKIDDYRRLRGELPLEVQDLEDEIIGLETRIKNIQSELNKLESEIKSMKNQMIESEGLIKKYETQQMKVRNNREYDSLTKEIEYQNLEIKICEKRIKEYAEELKLKNEVFKKAEKIIEEKRKDLEYSKSELTNIVGETQKDEEELIKLSQSIEDKVEERLLNAYKRIRTSATNGLVVVPIKRDACGGCFNKIPPQRQLDVCSHKKVIVCEYCGRILIDDEILVGVQQAFEKNKLFKK
jgi:predicted  nucleic acid-binding Zn-ribbon protein